MGYGQWCVVAAAIPVTCVYVIMNALFVRWLRRQLASLRVRVKQSYESVVSEFAAEWNNGRAGRTGTFIMVSTALFLWLVTSPQNLYVLCSLLAGFALLISGLLISIVARFSIFRRLTRSPGVLFLSATAPTIFLLMCNGYAAQWVDQVLSTSAVNAGMALNVARGLLLCASGSLLLAITVVVLELALILVPQTAARTRREGLNEVELLLLIAATFFAAYAATFSLAELPSRRLGSLLIGSAAFDFDAGTATHCQLSAAEKALAQGDSPTIKALFLATSQEKALLLKKSETHDEPIELRRFTPAGSTARQVQVLRWVDCYKVN